MIDKFKELCKKNKVNLLKGFNQLFKEINMEYSFDKQYRKPIRSEMYLDFIRDKECCLASNFDKRSHSKTEPHHVEGGGTGGKCSDLLTVPLCRECHTEYHNTRKLEDLQHFRAMINEYLEEYVKMSFMK